MRKGSKLGWLMVTMSIMLTAWLILSKNTFDAEVNAATVVTTIGDFTYTYDDADTSTLPTATLTSYVGSDTDVTVPNSVEIDGVTYDVAIAANAFYGTSVESVNVGDASSVSQDAFKGVNTLTYMDGTGSYTSYYNDGLLYTASGDTLYLVPSGLRAGISESDALQPLQLPTNATFTTIASGAFAGVSGAIQSVYIGQNVVSIPENELKNAGVKTIWGVEGSTAETYANNNGIAFNSEPGVETSSTEEEVSTTPTGSSSSSEGTASDTTATSSTATPTTPTTSDTTPISTSNDDTTSSSTRRTNNGGGSSNNSGSSNNGSTNSGGGSTNSNNTTTPTSTAPQQTNPNVAGTQQGTAPTSASTQSVGGSTNSTSGGASGSGGHYLDDTPTTGVEDIDPRYLFCLGMALSGIALILYSRQNTLRMQVATRTARERQLD